MKLQDFEQMFKEGKFRQVNKTVTYLAPTMNYYDNDLLEKVRALCATGVYIDDLLCDLEGEYYLFFLIDTRLTLKRGIVKDFNKALKEIREHNACAHDYPFGELLSGKLHVIVFKVPEEYYPAYSRIMDYLNGRTTTVKYSRMYPEEDIDKLFVKVYGEKNRAVKVLRQDSQYKEYFERIVNRVGAYMADHEGNVDWITLPEGAELEFLPEPREELLNYERLQEDQEV